MTEKPTYEELVQRVKTLENALSTQKRAEETLRIIHLSVNKSANAVFLMRSDGRLIYVNDATCRSLGYSRGQLLTMTVHDLSPDLRPEIWPELWRKIRAVGSSTIESHHRTKDGLIFPVEVTVHFVEIDGKEYNCAFARDITERKQAEEALKKSEERLSLAVKATSDGIWDWYIDYNVAYASPRCCELLGIKPNANPVYDLESWNSKIHPDDFERIMSRLNDHLENKTPYSVEYRHLHHSGEYRWQRSQGVALFNEKGKAYRMVGSIQDIHKQKQAEEEKARLQNRLQQAQRMESIGTLAAGIAHDFNNILYNIIGYAEVAQNYQIPKDHPAQDSVEEILRASDRATDLVKQILTFSRKKKQEKVKFQVSSIIKEAIKLLQATVPATIEIQEDIAAKNDFILADPGGIHQMLMNLCTNAIYAMRENGGVLKVSLGHKELEPSEVSSWAELLPEPYLMLTISDTGHGMEKAVNERIFDPYFTTKPAGEGTGLGLSVVHGIVKSCGGIITVESEQGKGSSFKVLFPQVARGKVQETEVAKTISRGSEKILFLDNEKSIVKMGKVMLEGLGYAVVTETSGPRALTRFSKHPEEFDLVITGMTMPQMTGDKFSEELIRIQPNIPIILCTGFSELITDDKAREIGIKAFVFKPITTQEMATTIRQVLDR